ncbi:MAG: hypothetical protein FJX11_01400 [Alphaproteobacteria bacterium]|nr:hypothetical protein [Alphaproteobacteria bacterium]
MRFLVALVLTSLLASSALAQQPPAAAQTCQSQYIEAPGLSAAALLARGYDIKAAVPGALWLQKDREVFFCNTGRVLDT